MSKQEKSIGELVLAKNDRLNYLFLFTKNHMVENNPCFAAHPSIDAYHKFDIGYEFEANIIAGYIESLQKQIDEFKK